MAPPPVAYTTAPHLGNERALNFDRQRHFSFTLSERRDVPAVRWRKRRHVVGGVQQRWRPGAQLHAVSPGGGGDRRQAKERLRAGAETEREQRGIAAVGEQREHHSTR